MKPTQFTDKEMDERIGITFAPCGSVEDHREAVTDMGNVLKKDIIANKFTIENFPWIKFYRVGLAMYFAFSIALSLMVLSRDREPGVYLRTDGKVGMALTAGTVDIIPRENFRASKLSDRPFRLSDIRGGCLVRSLKANDQIMWHDFGICNITK